MSDDLNHATRCLLQVVLDMLKLSPEALEKQGSNYSGEKSPWRCEQPCVEAAWRAAKEAQQMLVDAQAPRPFSLKQDPDGVVSLSQDSS